jgi:hypothetical protein
MAKIVFGVKNVSRAQPWHAVVGDSNVLLVGVVPPAGFGAL